MNSVKRSKYDRRVLLRLSKFILPPLHPSVKEMYPRGAISYDQIGIDRSRWCLATRVRASILGLFYLRTRSLLPLY